jgi:hypothetical protein
MPWIPLYSRLTSTGQLLFAQGRSQNVHDRQWLRLVRTVPDTGGHCGVTCPSNADLSSPQGKIYETELTRLRLRPTSGVVPADAGV